MSISNLQELAEKISGKYWEKGDLRRVYVDAGWNTKKMSTKTFIWQNESGEFVVSCKVDCPAQPWQWCKSQEDEIKEELKNRIDRLVNGEIDETETEEQL